SISEIASIPAIWPYVKLIIRNLRGRQHPVAMVFLYRSLQFFFCWNVFVTHCIHLTGLPLVCSSMTLQYIFLFSQLCNIFNGVFGMLFFTQISNHMGHFLIVVEKMFFAVSSFVLLSVVYIIAFTVGFSFVADVTYRCPDLAASNSTEIAFSSLIRSGYETFILNLGVTAPQDWYFSSNAYPLLIIIIYLASTVFNTVMLFNLMVAIMNHRVTELCVHTKSLVKLAQLSIYLFVELKINSTRKLLKFGSHSRKRCLFDGVDGEKFFMYTVEPVTVPPEEEN
ncbi:hypothetical protein CAPTEDRAFT_202746, partial [Capitella teleta]